MERFTEAEEEYRRSISINPNLAAAHYNLGKLLYGMNRFAEAEKEYHEAISINPDIVKIHKSLSFY